MKGDWLNTYDLCIETYALPQVYSAGICDVSVMDVWKSLPDHWPAAFVFLFFGILSWWPFNFVHVFWNVMLQ